MKKTLVVLSLIMVGFMSHVAQTEAMSGVGTKENPFIVYTCTDLQNIQSNVAAHYVLGSDIDCTDTVNWNIDSVQGVRGFQPIVGFAGTLNGFEYRVLGLTIHLPLSEKVGFVGNTTKTAIIQNMTFDSVDIIGHSHVGSIVGMNDGIITHSETSGNITGVGAGSSVGGIAGSNVSTSASIFYSGSSAHISNINGTNTGGIVGSLGFPDQLAEVENSHFSGTVIGGEATGGIAGRNNRGVIYSSHSTGAVEGSSCVGGIIGQNDGSPSLPFTLNVYTKGTVNATVSNAGGIVGCGRGYIANAYNIASVSAGDNVAHAIAPIGYTNTIEHSYYDTQVGPSVSGGGTGLTTAQMKTQSSYHSEWYFGVYWYPLSPNLNDGYPQLKSFTGPDLKPPTGTLSSPTTTWTKFSIPIIASATDEKSGIKHIITPSKSKNYNNPYTHNVSQNGVYTFQFEDNAGNISSESITISLIDKIFPTATFTLDNENWTKNPVTIHISAYDLESGLNGIVKPGLPTVYADSTSHTVSANGSYQFRVMDKVSNILNHTVVVTNIDKNNPTLIVTPNTTTWTNAVTIQAVGTDPTSGIKQIKMPDGTYVTSPIASFVATSNGTYTFEAEDLAGNMTTTTITITNIDEVHPTASFDPLTRDWSPDAVSVETSFEDTGGSFFKQHRFVWTTDMDAPLLGWSSWDTSSTFTHTQLQQGSWYLHVEVEDNAGNIAHQRGGPYRIDTTGPSLAVDFSEITATFNYGAIGSKDLRFSGNVTEDNPSTSVEVGYYIERASGGAKLVPDKIILEKEEEVQATPFSAVHTITSILPDGDYRLVVYAKNRAGLQSSESVLFRVTLPPPSSKPNVNISVHPQPSGNWQNYLQDVYVTDNGDYDALATAVKQYEVTNEPTLPSAFTRILPVDQKIPITQAGMSYVHIKYTLDGGATVVSTTGPYMIDTAPVGTYEVRLENGRTNESHRDWTKDDLQLIITDPNTPSISGYIKQYRIENYHIDWQTYLPNTKIQVEGKNRVFVRIVNRASTSGEQLLSTAYVDKTAPSLTKLLLKKEKDQTYSVTAQTEMELSGVSEAKLDTGMQLVGGNNVYNGSGIPNKPLGVTFTDNAGNQSEVLSFAPMPNVSFNSPYSPELDVYRSDVVATISGEGTLSYKLGTESYTCASNPCTHTISKNTTLVSTLSDGVKSSSHVTLIENIDKSPLRLVLNAHRDAANAKSITFKWNYNLSNGTLTCRENGHTNTYAVAGKTLPHAGWNYTYVCSVVGSYGGEMLTSNEIVLYPDQRSPLDGAGGMKEILVNDMNVYIEESRIGDSFLINSKSNNFKKTNLTIPDNAITQ